MGERIQKIRQVFGLSQEQFAYGIKVSAAEAASYETGECDPPREIMERVCMIYGIRENWLDTGTGRLFFQEADNKNLRWFMLWDPDGKHDPERLWLVDKIVGFSDLKVALLADIAAALV